jgi:hypothetical protein
MRFELVAKSVVATNATAGAAVHSPEICNIRNIRNIRSQSVAATAAALRQARPGAAGNNATALVKPNAAQKDWRRAS